MQLKCQKENCCGSLERSSEYIELTCELGFIHKVRAFKCKTCGDMYIICQDCEGEGFAQTTHGHFDCESCNGSGIILVKK